MKVLFTEAGIFCLSFIKKWETFSFKLICEKKKNEKRNLSIPFFLLINKFVCLENFFQSFVCARQCSHK